MNRSNLGIRKDLKSYESHVSVVTTAGSGPYLESNPLCLNTFAVTGIAGTKRSFAFLFRQELNRPTMFRM